MIRIELVRAVRFGLLATGLLLPLAVGVLLRLIAEGPARTAGPDEEPAAARCEATRLDASCPAGERCAAGRCLAARVGERTGRGEECSGRACALGSECHRGSCLPLGTFPVAPAVCREPAVRERLDELIRRCTQARGERSLLTECGADAWRDVSTGKGFEELVMGIPGAFSVFFPNGEPRLEGTWPGVSVRSRYAERIRGHAPAMAKAQALLIVGRASVSGGQAQNYALAQRRAALVEGLVREALGPSVPEIRGWGLAADFTLSITSMRQRMPAEPIADSAENEAKLVEMRAPSYEIPEGRWDEISQTLNRVVFVVPLPCDGHEFNPQPAFCGPGCRSERSP